jgi:hypothetical protein
MIHRVLGCLVLSIVAAATACSSSDSSSGGASPGASSAQLLPVGSACAKDSDCGSAPFYCMTDHPGGYCMRDCDIKNGDADCPSEAICQFDGTKGECHKKCNGDSDCRSPGYTCGAASSDPMNMASHAFCDAMDMPMDGGPDAMDAMPDAMSTGD